MALSVYDAYVPMAQCSVRSLRDILKKAESFPNSKDLLQKRIYEDMFPLSRQIEVVCQFAFVIAADCMGEAKLQEYDPAVESFDAAYALLRQAEDALGRVDREVTDKRAEEPVLVKMSVGPTCSVPLKEKMVGWNIPQLMFHLTTSYDILRKEGIPLGKGDYIFQFMLPYHDLRVGRNKE